MCKKCDIIKTLFDAAQETALSDHYANYAPIMSFFEALEIQNRIELFAGDCSLKEAANVFYDEKHYTVCHYLKCKQCGQIFFVGACIRGAPVFRIVNDINKENLTNKLWGHIGTKFDGTK